MNLLLDTHVLLWWQLEDRRLGKKARELILQQRNHILVSSISFWEIAIKYALGKLPMNAGESMASALEDGFRILPFDGAHALAVEKLPHHHGDPFDRALLAQAKHSKLSLLSNDAAMHRYASAVSVVKA
jgi:PIN domain nuclease of toxin-antitoxin system